MIHLSVYNSIQFPPANAQLPNITLLHLYSFRLLLKIINRIVQF